MLKRKEKKEKEDFMRVKKKEVYTLATLALLTLSLVFTNFSAPIDMSSQVEGAPQQSVLQYLHSEEPIETLHLDLEEAPATITMWGGYYYAYPWSTFWYTETHQYHLTSWNDNGDGGFSPSDQIDMTDDLGDVYWYHVDAITIQMALTRKDMPQPPAIIEYTGPYPMLSPETTIWNEIFPFPGNMYHLSGWMDNGDNALSASDQISMWNMQTGEPSEWHIDQVIVYLDLTQKWSPPGPITNPITTYWHELYPVYCRRYHLSSWRDNGDKKLSASDQIDMENLLTGKIEWYHVDRVTITMFLSPKEVPGLQIAVEYTRSNEEFPWTNPITTLWHEVYPQFSNKYHLSSWTDNEDGILSPSDQIDLTNPKAGQTTWWHVDRITIDIILRRKIANPISLYWRELIPVYYRRKHIIAWRDTGQVEGMLSPGDIITTVDEQGKTDPNLNVDEMTVTLVVTDKQTEATKYLEFEGGFNHMYDALTNPITTYWHEIYPMFSNRYHLYSWEDNGDEIISASDQIVMVDMKTGAFVQYHVDSISYGIKVTRTPVTRHLHSMDTLEPIHMDRVDESIVPIHLDAVAGIIDLTNPKTTYWHELYPNYSNEYHLSSWEDNGDQILSASDQIDMTDELENVYWYHVERVTLTIFLTRKDIPQPPIAIEYMGPYEPRIYQPISTLWHEIFPQYSNVYHIASWEDQGDLYLSPSDQIDMKNLETSELSWWHVDRIATDIILTKKCTPYPKTTYWHELYPNWSNYYHLSSWIDNGDGTLSASDQIDMTNQDTQEITWYHVERVTTTIFLTEKPLGPTEIAMELMYPETLSFTNPTTTEWHEIYPVYCRRYHLTSWEDNGDGILSPSDQIDMTDEGGIVHWYHVDRISKDIILRRKMVDPITTYWHELYPEYSNEYHIHSWEDNGDRELSPSDQIDLLNIHEEITWYHVDDVTITLYVYKKEVGPGIYICLLYTSDAADE